MERWREREVARKCRRLLLFRQAWCVLRTEELHTAADLHPFTGYPFKLTKPWTIDMSNQSRRAVVQVQRLLSFLLELSRLCSVGQS